MKVAGKALILDANILIRLVLGTRVRALVLEHLEDVEFFSPQECFDDARRYLPELLIRRGIDASIAMQVLDHFEDLIYPLRESVYVAAYGDAMARIGKRDARDWTILAAALTLGCPIWTEDQDFFGTGVPTWTTDRVELYLASQPNESNDDFKKSDDK